MNKMRLGLAAACITVLMTAASCRTDQSLTSFLGYEDETYVASNKPHFINDISMGSSRDNSISMNTVIDRHVVNTMNDADLDGVDREDMTAPAAKGPGMAAINRDKDRETAKIQPAEGNTLAKKYASILGVLPNMLCNYSLYKFIDEWYGVRYRYGGTDKDGIDCSAFVQRLYEQVFNTNLVRTAFEQFQNASLTRRIENLREGDLVFFRIHSRKRITHVGIYLMNNFFVHASLSQGVMISNLGEEYWQRFFAGAGRILKNNNG